VAKLIVFNKPFQVLSQFTDEGERRTLSDFIDVKAVYPCRTPRL
jgi:23S rRNA pseudouridine2457 synthase